MRQYMNAHHRALLCAMGLATTLVASGIEVCALEAPVPITVQRLVPAGVLPRSWSDEPASAGVPFAAADSVTDVRQLGLAGASAGQFRVLERDRATGFIRWVLVDFISTGPGDALAVVDGHGNFGGPDLATDTGDRIEIATGPARFAIRKHGFNLVDRAQLGDVEMLAPHAEGGIVVQAGGTRYASACDAASDVRLEENGPVKAVLVARGTLRSTDGKPSLGYTARLHFYRGRSDCRVYVTLRNASIGTPVPCTFDAAWVEIPVALGPARAVDFGVCQPGRAGSSVAGALGASEMAYLYQGDNSFQRSARTGAITPYLTPSQGLKISFASVAADGVGGGDVAAGWVRVAEGTHAVLAGMRDLATLFPSGFDVRDGRLAIEIFSRHNPQHDLVFAWGAHETREILLDFGSSGSPGAEREASAADFHARLQYPLLGRCDFERYRDTGAIFGERQLVSVDEEHSFFAALGKQWKLADLTEANLALERQYGFHTTGGPNQFDQDLGQLLDFLRTGYAGRFLQGRLGATWKADQAVLHSDDFDFSARQNGVSDVHAPDPPTFHGKGAGSVFDDEHPHWTCLVLYYELTGDERIREAIEDYGEWRLYRAGNPQFGAIHGGGVKSFRLWSRCFRDVALLYQFTGEARYLDALHGMARTLTTTVETGTSIGRNLDRGYFYFGDVADPLRPIHLFFLTEMNSLAVLDAIRVLPDSDPMKEDLRDYLYGLAWFTLREARISEDAPGYPYRYDSAVPNLDPGKRGDQTGPLLVHGYEMSGDPEFLQAARSLAWHVLEYQSERRGAEIPTHVTVHAWLHRDECGAQLLEAQVQPNGDGSYTLQWTAPDAAREYIVKYGPRPLVENLDFDQKMRTWAIDPATAMNFWAATNIAGEPHPGAAGSIETFTTPPLPPGEWHFAVKVLIGRRVGVDAAPAPVSLQGHDASHRWRPRARRSSHGAR